MRTFLLTGFFLLLAACGKEEEQVWKGRTAAKPPSLGGPNHFARGLQSFAPVEKNPKLRRKGATMKQRLIQWRSHQSQ